MRIAMSKIYNFPSGEVLQDTLNAEVEARKLNLLDKLDTIRELVEDDVLIDLVAIGGDVHGIPHLFVASGDVYSTIGMFEIGKQVFINEIFNGEEE